MQVAKPGGTREQVAVIEWLDRSDAVRGRLLTAAERVPSLLECYDSWSGAVASFGECELQARALDRFVALDVFEERRPHLTALVNGRNEDGIAQVERLRSALPAFGRDLAALDLPREEVDAVVDNFVRSFRENVADWEMKGTDAARLMEQVTTVGDVVRSSGLPALSDHLDRTFAELIDGRRAEGRGTHDNIPWWKAVILAGMIGWWLVGMIVGAIFSGKPQLAGLFAIYGVIQVVHWIAFVLFC